MCDIFFKCSIEMLQKSKKPFVVAYGSTMVSNMEGWITQSHDHDEADTLIVCIMREVLELENQQIKFRILSPDTDVLMLVLYFAAKETSSNITFELLNSQNRRQVDVIS